MYNSPPNMIPGHGPVPPVVYSAQQRPFMQNPPFYPVNGPRRKLLFLQPSYQLFNILYLKIYIICPCDGRDFRVPRMCF